TVYTSRLVPELPAEEKKRDGRQLPMLPSKPTRPAPAPSSSKTSTLKRTAAAAAAAATAVHRWSRAPLFTMFSSYDVILCLHFDLSPDSRKGGQGSGQAAPELLVVSHDVSEFLMSTPISVLHQHHHDF